MKGLVFHGPRDIRLENVPDPILTHQRSAIVRIGKCGICGSDLHPYKVGAPGSGFCIGHEAVGEVVEAGPQVKRFKTGDRVLVTGSISCGECEHCLKGRAMICRNSPICRVLGQGQPGLGGCQAEAIEVPVADFNLHPLPSGLSDATGIFLTDNLATGWAGIKRAGMKQGASVAVIGLGAVGLSGVLAARAQGAERVFAADLIPERREAAARFGATPLGGDNVLEELREATGGYGVDCVLDTVGVAKTIELGLLATRRGGGMCVVGLPETATIEFPLIAGMVRNVRMAMACCSVQSELPEIFEAIDQGRLDPAELDALVTHDMALADGPAAYELFDARRDGVVKVLLTP